MCESKLEHPIQHKTFLYNIKLIVFKGKFVFHAPLTLRRPSKLITEVSLRKGIKSFLFITDAEEIWNRNNHRPFLICQ